MTMDEWNARVAAEVQRIARRLNLRHEPYDEIDVLQVLWSRYEQLTKIVEAAWAVRRKEADATECPDLARLHQLLDIHYRVNK